MVSSYRCVGVPSAQFLLVHGGYFVLLPFINKQKARKKYEGSSN